MDLHQQCLYCVTMYFDIGMYITILCRDHNECTIQISAEQLPDDGVAIDHHTTLLPFIPELYHDHLLHCSNDNFGATVVDIKNACIDLEQPPVRTPSYSSPYLDNRLACNPISNKYCDIFDDEIDLR